MVKQYNDGTIQASAASSADTWTAITAVGYNVNERGLFAPVCDTGNPCCHSKPNKEDPTKYTLYCESEGEAGGECRAHSTAFKQGVQKREFKLPCPAKGSPVDFATQDKVLRGQYRTVPLTQRMADSNEVEGGVLMPSPFGHRIGALAILEPD